MNWRDFWKKRSSGQFPGGEVATLAAQARSEVLPALHARLENHRAALFFATGRSLFGTPAGF